MLACCLGVCVDFNWGWCKREGFLLGLETVGISPVFSAIDFYEEK